MAQTSELLRSQLLSPPSKTPIQPELSESRLALLDTTGPSRVTFAEFAPLFDSDGLRIDASGLAGTQDTWGDQIAVTGLYRNASASIGQYHYETDGFHSNNDLQHDILSGIATVAFNPEFSLFGEFRRRHTEGGDRRLNFRIEDFSESFRGEVDHTLARVGFHAQPTYTSDLIGVFTHAELDTRDQVDFLGLGTIEFNSADKADTGEAQYIFDAGVVTGILGGTYTHNDRLFESTFLGLPDPPISASTEDINGYAYFYVEIADRVTSTFGGSLTSYERSDGDVDKLQFNPKLGLSVDVTDQITLRGAYLRNVKADLVSDQTIEPTTIAGFNQFYDAVDGSDLEQMGAGIDIKLGNRLWIGAEAIRRDWDVPVLGVSDAQTVEKVGRAYAYFVMTDDLALSAEFLHERSQSDAPFDFDDWRTTSVPVTLSYFSEAGLFGALSAEFVDHRFSDPGIGGEDNFVLAHATLGYRLPRNVGILSLEVQNLFDERFNFQNRWSGPT